MTGEQLGDEAERAFVEVAATVVVIRRSDPDGRRRS